MMNPNPFNFWGRFFDFISIAVIGGLVLYLLMPERMEQIKRMIWP
jgi:hypothetical protein